jgi:hypothetical protein
MRSENALFSESAGQKLINKTSSRGGAERDLRKKWWGRGAKTRLAGFLGRKHANKMERVTKFYLLNFANQPPKIHIKEISRSEL